MSSKAPLLPDHQQESHSPAWKRFLKAACGAVIVYILFSTVTNFFSLTDHFGFNDDFSLPWGPSEADGDILSCTDLDWGSPHPPAVPRILKFNIPVSSSNIFLLSGGSCGYGSIKTELADIPDGHVEMKVVSTIHRPRFFQRAKICHLGRKENAHGIGLYTPRPPFGCLRGSVAFDVTFRFPRTGTVTNPLVINSLETDMGIWSHSIGSLEDRVVFKSVTLSGSNAKVFGESVTADLFRCQTGNGQIYGSFNISNSLVLKTSNAAIEVDLRMKNKNGSSPTLVDMHTSNAPIKSAINLISTNEAPNASPAAFSVIAKTSNSPIRVVFLDAPTSTFSRLNLEGKTSNSPVHAKLHSTYEGSISLKTSSVFRPSIVQQETTPGDPSGKGRQWHMDISRIVRGALEARVWWGDDDAGKGVVSLTTSNGNNIVEL